MISSQLSNLAGEVALCEEGVDRNINGRVPVENRVVVALCEEGVDRNYLHDTISQLASRRPLRRGRG